TAFEIRISPESIARWNAFAGIEFSNSKALMMTFTSKTYRGLLLIENRLQNLGRHATRLCPAADVAHQVGQRRARGRRLAELKAQDEVELSAFVCRRRAIGSCGLFIDFNRDGFGLHAGYHTLRPKTVTIRLQGARRTLR